MSFSYKTIFTLLAAGLALTSCVQDLSEDCVINRPEVETKIINTPSDIVEGRLIAFLSEETVKDIEINGTGALKSAFGKEINILSVEPAIKIAKGKEEVTRKHNLHRWYTIEFDGISSEKAASKIASFSEVSALQYDKILRHGSDCRKSKYVPSLRPMADESLPFNDPMLVDQWHFINTGRSDIAATAKEGADINVKDVWKLTGGDPSVIVAVIDGPVKYDHPDIAANMWVNPGEIAGNGIDDDNNGYIDDIHGYNFEGNGPISWEGKEETGHGTHVAGTVAAVNNNGIGISGVAGGTGKGDGVRIMSCQIFENGTAAATSLASTNSFYYATNNGAQIAQCSYGYNGTYYDSDNHYARTYPLEQAAINYFLDPENCNSQVLDRNIAIYASGNDGHDGSSYPGALETVICVTALGPDYLPADYTNYGAGCNIAAPGGDLYIGTIKTDMENGVFDITDNKSRVLSLGIEDDYEWMNGTSMACPHVSGVVALGVSYALKLGKTFTQDEFTSMVLTSVNDIDNSLISGTKPGDWPGYGNDLDLSLYRKKMGTGAIDAWKLLMAIEGTPCVVAKVGESQRLDLKTYFGGSAANLTYTGVEIDAESKAALGLMEDPEMKYGKLSINPTKVGSGKVTITAIAGGEVLGGGDKVGGSEIRREISILSRNSAVSSNGGWL